MAPPKTRNEKSAPVLPDTFWEKARKWADKWRSLLTVTGAVVGAFLAAGSFFLEDHNKISKIQTDSQTISEISNKINATNEVVSAIRGRVDNIDGQLEILRPLVEFEIQSRLKKSSALPLRDFQRDLPNLHPVLKQARILGVR